ncbi:MAG TPA: hypothetical protein IAA29_16495 [Candidatus Paenibacillus intestinavium]|nr:hypothetical protein [Candidatus Paenibacillus intestinavium]
MNECLELKDTPESNITTAIDYNSHYEQILQQITAIKLEHAVIELQLFDEYEDLRLIGIIEDIDTSRGSIKMDGEWFALNKVKMILSPYYSEDYSVKKGPS